MNEREEKCQTCNITVDKLNLQCLFLRSVKKQLHLAYSPYFSVASSLIIAFLYTEEAEKHRKKSVPNSKWWSPLHNLLASRGSESHCALLSSEASPGGSVMCLSTPGTTALNLRCEKESIGQGLSERKMLLLQTELVQNTHFWIQRTNGLEKYCSPIYTQRSICLIFLLEHK